MHCATGLTTLLPREVWTTGPIMAHGKVPKIAYNSKRHVPGRTKGHPVMTK